MAKEIIANVKVQIPGGKATPAPPVGPALAPHGLNIAEFCQQFNDATQNEQGAIIPVEVIIYEDRTFDLKINQPLTSHLIKNMLGIEKGSGFQKKTKAGKMTKAQLKEIAQKKMSDFNTTDIEAAMKIVAGTAKSMGIDIMD
jgi:large subunit ribosomal protein L11